MLSALLHDIETQPELVDQAGRIAALLADRAHGRVVVSCRHARSFVPGLLGAWCAGATVELLPNVQPGTLDRVDADDEVAYVLHDDAARQGRSSKAVYVPEIVSAATPARATVASAWPDIAVRMVTSGTTERPKYITKSMAQLVAEIDVLAARDPGRALRAVDGPALASLRSVVGRVVAAALRRSHRQPRRAAAGRRRCARRARARRPDDQHTRAPARDGRGADAARLARDSSGAHLPGELHTSLALDHDWHLTDVLGSTETGGIATRDQPMKPWTPLPGVKVSAPDSLLAVSSPWCDASTIALGDRVELRADGTFQYLGRSSELVKIAGKRAETHAIEATIRAIPGVTDVALLVHGVHGVHGPATREPRVAVAVVVASDGPPVRREQITTAVAQQFDPVFVPRIVKIVPHIPRNERGKVEAETLRGVLGLDAAPTTDHIPVRRVGPGKYEAVIPRDLVFFRGHFDAFLILPGAVLVERLVWPIAKAELPAHSELRGIKRLRFTRPVLPDQQLSVTVKHDPGRVAFEVSCATSVVASGQLLVQ